MFEDQKQRFIHRSIVDRRKNPSLIAPRCPKGISEVMLRKIFEEIASHQNYQMDLIRFEEYSALTGQYVDLTTNAAFQIFVEGVNKCLTYQDYDLQKKLQIGACAISLCESICLIKHNPNCPVTIAGY
ncbi:hypothetical protein ABF87_08125 [Nitrosomonas sp. JL21]|uniref:hypothetical protein n=1 Tax=Nitrosomonas sp. JL21 TaxID=153949 RepID=UPI0013695D0B|nr:hypothetical protein [Nitrosomonas sp. JL21]MXS77929.1 hypothetical protein [Nitrosomonas sp. JL21]